MKQSSFYTLLISLLPGVGPSRYWSWLDIHKTPEKILLAAPDRLPKLNSQAKTALLEFQQQGEMSPLAAQGHQVLDSLEKHNAKVICHQQDDYPGLLAQISNPPPLLYVKGDAKLLSMPQVGIVGTRNPTHTGIENTRAFSRYLADGGFTITSGLALGIDGYAHEAALKAKGNTIAVMGTGIDQIYPQRHQRLADVIVERGGLLVTEFAPGTKPHANHFPRRNRIISGLSLGILVVEAAVKSGSLITARYALEQNREVFAIPGSIHNPQAKGCHALIKDGAQLVESGEDILKQLAGLIRYFAEQQAAFNQETLPAENEKIVHALTEDEKTLLYSIGYDTLAIDEIIERSGLSSAEASAILLNLELKGIIKQSSWGYEAIQEVV